MEKSYLESAAVVLQDRPSGMHVREIAQEVYARYPSLAADLEDLTRKLSSALSGAVKRKNPSFAKPTSKGKAKKGWYRLRQEKVASLSAPQQPTTQSSLNVGTGGEHAVISELLFNGFNAAKMEVDDGIDVVASKGKSFFHIQVKTSNVGSNGGFQFSISKQSFAKKNIGNTFYIFVMRRVIQKRLINDFLILPTAIVDRFVSTGLLKGKDKISLQLSPAGTDQFYLSRTENVSQYVNCWGEIK